MKNNFFLNSLERGENESYTSISYFEIYLKIESPFRINWKV